MPYTLMVRKLARGGEGDTVSRRRDAPRRRGSLGWMLDAHGMVRDVFVQIRKDQQQLKHAIALFGLRLVGALFQILHGGERIGKEPLQAFFADWRSFTAARECLVGAQKRFIQEVIQTKFRASVNAGGAGFAHPARTQWTETAAFISHP